jgi:hypothetical protein
MTITLSKEELEDFQLKLSEWYKHMFSYVLEQIQVDPFTMRRNQDDIPDIIKAYEEQNPKPDWRTLI